jgi:hypothetical protein
MELGNAIFGNSRGSYPIEERGGMEKLFIPLVNYVCLLVDHKDYWGGYIPEFKNDTFEIRGYYWGDCDCEEDHVDDCPCVLPNFVHKKTGLELSWYKYPFRDSYSNLPLTEELMSKIVEDCIESLKEI